MQQTEQAPRGRIEQAVWSAVRGGQSKLQLASDEHLDHVQIASALSSLVRRGKFNDLPSETVATWRAETFPVDKVEAGKKGAAARKGVKFTTEQRLELSKKRKGVFYYSYVLFARGALVEEVVHIMGFGQASVIKAQKGLRDGVTLKKLSPEERRRRKSLSLIGKPRHTRGREYPQFRERSFSLLKRLIQSDAFTHNLEHMKKLHGLYQRAERKLPDDIVVKMLLELSLQDDNFQTTVAVIREAIRTNPSLLEVLQRELRFVITAKQPPRPF